MPTLSKPPGPPAPLWPYLTRADRSRRQLGRGTRRRCGPCTSSVDVLPATPPRRAGSVEPGVVGRRHRGRRSVGILVVVTRHHRPCPNDDRRRPGWSRVVMAGRKPSFTHVPGGDSRSSGRGHTVPPVDRDQHTQVLRHRLRGIRPGGSPCVDARGGPLRRHAVGRRAS